MLIMINHEIPVPSISGFPCCIYEMTGLLIVLNYFNVITKSSDLNLILYLDILQRWRIYEGNQLKLCLFLCVCVCVCV